MVIWPTKNIDEVFEISINAVKAISDNNGLIWRTTEWNICHHLACNLQKEFPDFHVDIELKKSDKKRPDIVIHERENNERNLVVFQVKKKPSSKDISEDFRKIRQTFFNNFYHYKFGIFISIGKLPKKLPRFNKNKIRIIEVDGWKAISI